MSRIPDPDMFFEIIMLVLELCRKTFNNLLRARMGNKNLTGSKLSLIIKSLRRDPEITFTTIAQLVKYAYVICVSTIFKS
jgi:hypothetical protein